MSSVNRVLFVSITFLFVLNASTGLRCYTCSYGEQDTKDAYLCVTQPENLTGNPIRTCLSHMKYCTIVRIEMKETGKVTSFLRKCEESPTEDSDVESTSIVAHYRSCMTDLCNKGDGLDFIDEGFEGDSVAILVPDRSASQMVSINLPVAFFTIVTFLLQQNAF